MSREHTISYASVALNRILSQEETEERFDAHELELLSEYQNIKAGSYWQFRLNCAVMALEELKSTPGYGEANLTEFGIAINYDDYDKTESAYLKDSILATREFLHIWERVREQQAHNHPALATLTKETKSKVDATFVKPLLQQIIQQMRNDGFVLQNEEALKQDASEIIINGVQLLFENKEGTKEDMTFYLPGGQLAMTDYNAAPGKGLMCGAEASKCVQSILKALRVTSAQAGVPISAMTKESSFEAFPEGQEKKPSHAVHTESKSYQ